MKKYKCTNMECNYSCELRTDVFPHKCVNWDYIPTWVEMDGTEPVTKGNQLPKLTADVFDLPDCPEWANWAAINADGRVVLFSDMPNCSDDRWRVTWHSTSSQAYMLDDVIFDATDWQNSLIERPAKVLPEWCRVGEWVCYNNIAEESKYYFKVIEADENYIAGDTPDGKGFYIYSIKHLHPARLRPYNAEELWSLVGKIIKSDDDEVSLITDYSPHSSEYNVAAIYFIGGWSTADEIMKENYTIDGKPCGVLEHYENGEWVE